VYPFIYFKIKLKLENISLLLFHRLLFVSHQTNIISLILYLKIADQIPNENSKNWPTACEDTINGLSSSPATITPQLPSLSDDLTNCIRNVIGDLFGSSESPNTSASTGDASQTSETCTPSIAVRFSAGADFLRCTHRRVLGDFTVIRSTSVPSKARDCSVTYYQSISSISSTVFSASEPGRILKRRRGISYDSRSSKNTSIWSAEELSHVSHTYDVIPSFGIAPSPGHNNTYDLINKPTYTNNPCPIPQSSSPTYENLPCPHQPTYANIPFPIPTSFLPVYENLRSHILNSFCPTYENFSHNINSFDHTYHVLEPALPASPSTSPMNHAFIRTEPDGVSDRIRHPRKTHRTRLPDISLTCIPLSDPENTTLVGDELSPLDLDLIPTYMNLSRSHR